MTTATLLAAGLFFQMRVEFQSAITGNFSAPSVETPRVGKYNGFQFLISESKISVEAEKVDRVIRSTSCPAGDNWNSCRGRFAVNSPTLPSPTLLSKGSRPGKEFHSFRFNTLAVVGWLPRFPGQTFIRCAASIRFGFRRL